MERKIYFIRLSQKGLELRFREQFNVRIPHDKLMCGDIISIITIKELTYAMILSLTNKWNLNKTFITMNLEHFVISVDLAKKKLNLHLSNVIQKR